MFDSEISIIFAVSFDEKAGSSFFLRSFSDSLISSGRTIFNDFNFCNSEKEKDSTKGKIFFIKNTENDPIKRALNSTRYQLLTGKNIENPYKSDNYNNNTLKRQNKIYHQSSNSTIDSSSLRYKNGNNKIKTNENK